MYFLMLFVLCVFFLRSSAVCTWPYACCVSTLIIIIIIIINCVFVIVTFICLYHYAGENASRGDFEKTFEITKEEVKRRMEKNT